MLKKLVALNKINFKFNMEDNLKRYILIFIIGAISGYIYEEIYCFVMHGEIVNRGFLYGPYLPVYGFGACALTFFLSKKFKRYPVLLFFASAVITGVVEYLTGYILMEVYNARWWDYSGLLFNINGYVCLRSVLTFAIGSLLLVYIIDPIINYLISKKTPKINYIAVIGLFIIVLDFIITITFRHPF